MRGVNRQGRQDWKDAADEDLLKICFVARLEIGAGADRDLFGL